MCNVADPVAFGDAVNKNTLCSFTINTENYENMFDAKNKRIINVANAEKDTDAVNRKYVQEEIDLIKVKLNRIVSLLPKRAYSFVYPEEKEKDVSENSVPIT